MLRREPVLEPEDGVDVTRLLGVPLVELTDRTCRWPSSGEGARTVFCGKPPKEGSRYCPTHHRRSVTLA
jgi:hypothetical protein